MGTRRSEKASLQANCISSKLPPSPNVPFKRHDSDLKRSLLREGEKCRREKPLASLPPGCLQPPRLPHSRELPRRFEGLEGICDAIKTFLPAKHETPKVYGKPLSSGCLHIFRHPGSCSSKKPRKSKRPIMVVSGWRLCDYWLPHESLNFWDAEPISAAKCDESSSAPGARGTPAMERGRVRGAHRPQGRANGLGSDSSNPKAKPR